VQLLDSESYKRAEGAAAVLSSDIVRWDAISLVSSGVVWIGSNFVAFSVADPTTGAGRSYFALYVVALLLLVLGFIGLHELQRASYGVMGRAGFYAVVVASLAQVLGLVVFLAGSSALLWLVSPVGSLSLLVGWVLYGAATLQAGVFAWWYGVLLLLSLPVSLVLTLFGNMFFGLVLLVLGFALWTDRGVIAEHPPRVRSDSRE
jgi:hypothetical protein